jgi:hypothetical protein
VAGGGDGASAFGGCGGDTPLLGGGCLPTPTPTGAGGALCELGVQAANAALIDVALLLLCPLVSMIGPLPEVFRLTPCSRMHDTNFAG